MKNNKEELLKASKGDIIAFALLGVFFNTCAVCSIFTIVAKKNNFAYIVLIIICSLFFFILGSSFLLISYMMKTNKKKIQFFK